MTHIALIKSGAVRDAQYAKTVDAELIDDEAWIDAKNAEIFVGTYKGVSAETAIQQAAAYAGTNPANIRLISV